MGLLLPVYKSKAVGDCTRNGISSKADLICVVNVPGPCKPNDNYPNVLLVKQLGMLALYPAVLQGSTWYRQKGWYMMGGNYAASSDSRFTDACECLMGHPFYGAIPIHDRCED